MDQTKFLNTIAQKGYDIGFGAKKNFASFDIINKLPTWVGFISLAIGIIQIAYENIPLNKELSILLILVGIAIIYIEPFKNDTEKFEKEGVRLTRLFNRMRDLYYSVDNDNNYQYVNYENQYQTILNDFYSNNISRQVFMSQWFAHYKFFYELQIDWVDIELKFKFFRDKVPNSLKTTVFIILLLIVPVIVYGYKADISRFFHQFGCK
ncbi:SLATT domain-containing protein [Chryseobacterium sp. cx-311]|uniref:SLATT domain-containing protein n=1 Tax=Marnyiella aurantia TaxID=2758037 RepID=UPI001AE3B7EC|nr:SLATT domain-containing protein [Marnyiella aurantia]MBP0611504.1 SLATT domain-containing protein [Marnyiella aurantia]